MPNLNVTDARVKAEDHTEQTMRDALANYREAIANHHLTVDQPAPTAAPFIEMLHQRLGPDGELFVVPEPEGEGETPDDTHDENGVPYSLATAWVRQALIARNLLDPLDLRAEGTLTAFLAANDPAALDLFLSARELDRRAENIGTMWTAFGAPVDLATLWTEADAARKAQ